VTPGDHPEGGREQPGNTINDNGEDADVEEHDELHGVAEAEPGKAFWAALIVGWVSIVIGLFGILDHRSSANPFKVFRLLVGLNVFNDAVVVPVVLGLAFAVHRWAPRWLLAPMQIWLIVSGVVSLYAYPLVGAFGKKPSQPSELPFNYAHNLLIVLGCITLFCLGLAVRSWRRAHRSLP
jgi:hypothetical protein